MLAKRLVACTSTSFASTSTSAADNWVAANHILVFTLPRPLRNTVTYLIDTVAHRCSCRLCVKWFGTASIAPSECLASALWFVTGSIILWFTVYFVVVYFQRRNAFSPVSNVYVIVFVRLNVCSVRETYCVERFVTTRPSCTRCEWPSRHRAPTAFERLLTASCILLLRRPRVLASVTGERAFTWRPIIY